MGVKNELLYIDITGILFIQWYDGNIFYLLKLYQWKYKNIKI